MYEPGQFSIRGSIVDVYSFAEERPVRIDFFRGRGGKYSLFRCRDTAFRAVD